MIGEIVQWAEQQKQVSLVLLSGSRAGDHYDRLSDFDISIFANDSRYINTNDWLSPIGSLLLCISDKFSCDDQIVPTRLVIFENGAKVDFSFYPVSLLNKMISDKKLFPGFDIGFQVLYDPEKKAQQLPKPGYQSYLLPRPTEEYFNCCVDEFWFEAFHVAKYLTRNDLWTAHSREAAMKPWILMVLQWQAAADSDFSLRFKPEGKQMASWITPNYLSKMGEIFGGWSADECLAALIKTMHWFESLAEKTSLLLGFQHDKEKIRKIKTIIEEIIASKKKYESA